MVHLQTTVRLQVLLFPNSSLLCFCTETTFRSKSVNILDETTPLTPLLFDTLFCFHGKCEHLLFTESHGRVQFNVELYDLFCFVFDRVGVLISFLLLKCSCSVCSQTALLAISLQK